MARASDGSSTAGASPNGLGCPTPAVRTGSGRDLGRLAHPRMTIDAPANTAIAPVLENLIAVRKFRDNFLTTANTTLLDRQREVSPTAGNRPRALLSL